VKSKYVSQAGRRKITIGMAGSKCGKTKTITRETRRKLTGGGVRRTWVNFEKQKERNFLESDFLGDQKG